MKNDSAGKELTDNFTCSAKVLSLYNVACHVKPSMQYLPRQCVGEVEMMPVMCLASFL